MSKTTCQLCGRASFKYKCPNCKVPSCSLECFRLHKAQCSTATTVAQDLAAVPVAATEQLQPLITNRASRNDIEDLFRRFPQLRPQLYEIYDSTLDPAKKMQNQGGHSGDAELFGQRSDKSNRFHRGWSPDKGLDKGMALLQAKMAEEGQNSEALQEFLKLFKPLDSKIDQ